MKEKDNSKELKSARGALGAEQAQGDSKETTN